MNTTIEKNRTQAPEGIVINKLPVPTWNHLKINEAYLPGTADPDGSHAGSRKICLDITDKQTDPVVYDIDVSDGKGIFVDITAKEDAEVILRYSEKTAGEAKTNFPVGIYISQAEGVNLHLVQVNSNITGRRLYSSVHGVIADRAALRMTGISLNSKETYLEGKVTLKGEGSSYDTYTAYILSEGETLDMNYVADHVGKKTVAEIVSAGVLHKGCRKISRQTVNFISGCSGSVGRENEEVLLLDDDVVNLSAPLILCTEEDVEGEHGASIGQPDEETVYYLMSRGLTGEQVLSILSTAKVEAALLRIGHEETSELVYRALDRGES